MTIELSQPYMSIETLKTHELPAFTVLIGRNGAGKTQLLDALKEGRAVIPGIGVDDIALYNMTSFRSPNTGKGTRGANHFARMTADSYFLSSADGKPRIQTAKDIFDQYVRDIERNSDSEARDDFENNLRDDIRHLPDFSVFAASDRDCPYKRALYTHVLAPLSTQTNGRQRRSSHDQAKNSFNGDQAALVSAAMKLSDKLPHELTQDDIMRAWHYEGDTLSNSISAVFAAYRVDQFIWAHKRIETDYVAFTDLIAQHRTKYPPPWETLRKIMAEMRDAAGDDGLFDFVFSDPDDYELHMGNYEQFSFKSEMTNRTNGAQYDLTSLSSGEVILMALCLASFNQYLGRRRPKLLLLDELDAMLHPSMIEALVRTLKILFVSRGTKVLMASHSPMTVAALDESDIFRVVRTGGHVKVSRATKSQAINELSEGIATVDVGLRIAAFEGAKVTILTEGHNTKHLKKWVELNFPQDVHVLEDLEQYSNDQQLLAYGRLLAKMNANTHFVVVWDCDAASKAETLRGKLSRGAKITPYAFPNRPDNTIAQKGIENNYDEDILEPYSTTTTRNDGTLVSRGFQNNRKTEFADYVLENGTPDYFTNFQDLRDIIRGILVASG